MQTIHDEGRTWHFPDKDRHFTGKNKKGVPAFRNYQHDRLLAAYKHVTDYSVAVDVGAHVGLITRKLAERFKMVFAFEPCPENFECLQANTADLSNVITFIDALGDHRGQVCLDRGKVANSGNAQVVDNGGIAVSLNFLDDYDLPDLGVLKIDVQGYEHLVLEGARQQIQAFAPVMIVECEPWDKLLRKYQKPGEDKVADFFNQEHWDVRLAETISQDRIYVPGVNGVKPYTKYAIKGDYHWRRAGSVLGSMLGNCFDKVVAYVNSQNHGTTLDVGCGDGFLTAKLIGAFGVDDNAGAVALARKHCVPCVQLSVYRLGALGKPWGAVTMFDVFEHLPRQVQALNAIAKITDTLYILNPDPGGKHWHTREFTGPKLVEFVQTYGWKVIHIERFDEAKKTLVHLRRD